MEKRDDENSLSSPLFLNKIISKSSEVTEDFNESDFLNVEEAAKYLRILSKDGSPCKQRIRNLVSQGKLPSYKPFGRLLIKRSELKLLVESSKKGEFKCR